MDDCSTGLVTGGERCLPALSWLGLCVAAEGGGNGDLQGTLITPRTIGLSPTAKF
jgi:hypothetical protein